MTGKKIYLVGPGGCGINLLYHLFGTGEKLGKHYLKGGGEFVNMHQRFPQVRNTEKTKVLYLTAHPMNMLLSFERRFFNPEKWEIMIRLVQGDENGFRRIAEDDDPTLDRYADQGQNLYDFHGHAAGWRWYCKINNIESLFLKYEEIPQSISEISAFVGRNPKAWHWHQRESNYQADERKELIDRLAEIHFDDIKSYEEWNLV